MVLKGKHTDVCCRDVKNSQIIAHAIKAQVVFLQILRP